MAKLAVLEISTGSFATGFAVRLQVSDDDSSSPIVLHGQLPPAPEVVSHYESWQLGYRSRGKGFRQIQAIPSSTRQRSNLKVLASELEKALNGWLDSGGEFQKIRDHLLKTFATQTPVRLIIQTDRLDLWKLPWELWHLVQEHPNVGVALSKQDSVPVPMGQQTRSTVRILALLGDSTDINIGRDLELLQQHLPPEAELYAPKQVERLQLSNDLWTQPWDILFFAGHSSSRAGEGKLYLTADDYLMIPDLKYALERTIAHGLQLAIFNSCDGLQLARDLADLQLPATIVMREPIPDEAAQKFLGYLLQAFAQEGRSLYGSVREACQRLQGLEDKYPCVSWLPLICQNPSAPMLWWRSFLPVCPSSELPALLPVPVRGSKRLKWLAVLAISLGVTCLVMGVRSLGWLESAELWAYDRTMQLQPSLQLDPRLLLVTVNDQDVRQFKKPLKDETIYNLLKRLEAYHPKVVGLDIYRDISFEPGTRKLLNYLKQSKQVISICDVGDEQPTIDPPSTVLPQYLGFADALLFDQDNVTRRYSLAMAPGESTCKTPHSFSLKIIEYFLPEVVNYSFNSTEVLQINSTKIRTLRANEGGYQQPSQVGKGWQVLVNYRSSQKVAQEVSLTQIMNGNPDDLQRWIQGRVVLIGYVGTNTKDYHATPVGQMPGVIVHAHVVSQLLDTLAGKQAFLLVGTALVDATQVWILAVIGGMVGGRLRARRLVVLITSIATTGLLIISLTLFSHSIWMPLVPSLAALMIALQISRWWRMSKNK